MDHIPTTEHSLKALNLVHMDDAIRLSTRMRQMSHSSQWLCVVEHCHAEGDYCRLARFNGFWQSSLWHHKRGLKRQTLYQWWGSENRIDEVAQNTINRIYEAGIHALIRGWTLRLREMMTMVGRRDVIQRGPASFWCMKQVLELVIIPVLN